METYFDKKFKSYQPCGRQRLATTDAVGTTIKIEKATSKTEIVFFDIV